MKNKHKHTLFVFTRTQWMGTLMLFIIVALVYLFVHFLPAISSSAPNSDGFALSPELADSFSAYIDSTRAREYRNKYKRHFSNRINLYADDPNRVKHPRAFDPNAEDSASLVYIGLSPYQAHMVMRYRTKGGRFRKPESLQRLYGMDSTTFAMLAPYIVIPRDSDTIARHNLYPAGHIKKDTILELNSCDTASLLLIRGIGKYTAVRIVSRRDSLGGYVNVEQLREIAGVKLDTLLHHFTVDPERVKHLAVNCASIHRLTKHPYLNYSQADKLYNYRRRHLYIKSIDELLNIDGFSQSDIDRLRPYLDFSRPDYSK